MSLVGRRSLLLAGGTLWLPTTSAPAAAPVRVQILVAKASKVSNVTTAELRQMYRGRLLTLGGQTAVPLNHPSNAPDRVGFDRVLFDMSPDAVARYWVDQKIRGGSPPPRSVDSVGLLLRSIARLPGAIGYLREGFISPELRVVTVDGRLPSDSSYTLTYGG